jgi:hypothetical protein
VKKCYAAPGGVANVNLPDVGPLGYSSCAFESGTCSFSGTQVVAYGGNGSFSYRTLTNGTACTPAAFGAAPHPGTREDCYLANPRPSVDFTQCATERGTCSTSNGPIWYGAYGVYNVTTAAPATGTVGCDNTAMGGDPLPNVAKGCYTYAPNVSSG